MDNTEVFSPAELAAFLGCKRTKVYELLRERDIPSYTIGRLRRVRRQDAEDFIKARMSHRQGAIGSERNSNE